LLSIAIEHGGREDVRRVAQDAILTAGGDEHNAAIGQIARLHDIGTAVTSTLLDTLIFVRRGKAELAQACAIHFDLVNPVPDALGSPIRKDHSLGIERYVKALEHAAFQFRNKLLDCSRFEIERADPVVRRPAS
jgi:hypothetical protein